MTVTVKDMIKDLKLEILNEGKRVNQVKVSDINRPGLQFSGFYNYYANERVQVVGKAEWSFLDAMQPDLRQKRLKKYFEFDNPCTIITRNLEPHGELLQSAREYDRWILRTESVSTRFINKLMNYLDYKLAPETRLHGVLVDVYGVGMLITGESGIAINSSPGLKKRW